MSRRERKLFGELWSILSLCVGLMGAWYAFSHPYIPKLKPVHFTHTTRQKAPIHFTHATEQKMMEEQSAALGEIMQHSFVEPLLYYLLWFTIPCLLTLILGAVVVTLWRHRESHAYPP